MTPFFRRNLPPLAALATGAMVYLVLCGTPLIRTGHRMHGHNAAHGPSPLGCYLRDADLAHPAPELKQPPEIGPPPIPLFQPQAVVQPEFARMNALDCLILPMWDPLYHRAVLLLI